MRAIPNGDSTADVVLDWLHEEGWSIDHSNQNGVWIVTGTRGSQKIRTTGGSLEEAWMRATEQAQLQSPVGVHAQ